jgi:hypothetical protein
MAPGSALTVPRLEVEALEPFQPRTAYSGAFGLARNLLLAEVGRPEGVRDVEVVIREFSFFVAFNLA